MLLDSHGHLKLADFGTCMRMDKVCWRIIITISNSNNSNNINNKNSNNHKSLSLYSCCREYYHKYPTTGTRLICCVFSCVGPSILLQQSSTSFIYCFVWLCSVYISPALKWTFLDLLDGHVCSTFVNYLS